MQKWLGNARIQGPFGVNVAGYLNSEKGVGEGLRTSIRSLQAAGIPIALNNFIDPGSVNRDGEFQATAAGNPYSVNLLHMNGDELPQFMMAQGIPYLTNRYNIGYWAWELPLVPKGWIQSFEHLDELWVPSSFVRDAFAPCAPIPLVRMPHAIRETFQIVHDRPYFNLPQDTCLFLFLFDFASIAQRKNPFGIIEAFKKAFAATDNVLLLLKSSRASLFPEAARCLEQTLKGVQNMRWTDGVFSKSEIDSLLNACDCYVSLHRSEGFGLTLAEAMSLGKAVIATAYSGNMDFMTPGNSLPVRYRLIPIERDQGPYERGALWADPDLDHAAELMQWVCRNRDQAKELGQRARCDIRRQFGHRVVGQRMRARLAKLASIGELSVPVTFRIPLFQRLLNSPKSMSEPRRS